MQNDPINLQAPMNLISQTNKNNSSHLAIDHYCFKLTITCENFVTFIHAGFFLSLPIRNFRVRVVMMDHVWD